jgi:CheY-like chemotaxis protein
MISALFSSDGHQVDAARDGAHAVELLAQGSYDLVIADPRADVGGQMFAETLRARWPGLVSRAIFATADVRPETEDWLRRLGGRYVHKPVNARQLRREAAEVLATR